MAIVVRFNDTDDYNAFSYLHNLKNLMKFNRLCVIDFFKEDSYWKIDVNKSDLYLQI